MSGTIALTNLGGIANALFNSVTANSTAVTALSVGGTTLNSTPTYTSVTTFSANVVLSAGLQANGGFGSAGQVLTSNGTGTYWSTVSGGGGSVNTAAQYSWTNTHSFAANLTIGSTGELVMANGAGIEANGSLGSAGQVLTSNGTGVYWTAAAAGTNTAAAYAWTNTHSFSSNVTFTGTVINQANAQTQTLSDSSGTINWNVANGQVATVTLTGTGRAVAAPTNLKVGTYILHILQDATGGRTITSWNSVFKWSGGAAWAASNTSPNARDVLSFISDGTNLYGTWIPDVR